MSDTDVVGDAAEGVSGFLSQQWGPLPVWGWGVAMAGGLGVGYLVLTNFGDVGGGGESDRPQRRGRRPVATEGALAAPGAGGTTGQVDARTGFTTNSQWHREALDWLVDDRGSDPVAADTALSRYLSGQALTEQGANLIGAALTEFGRPPQGAPTIRRREPDGGSEETDPTPPPEDGGPPAPPDDGGGSGGDVSGPFESVARRWDAGNVNPGLLTQSGHRWVADVLRWAGTPEGLARSRELGVAEDPIRWQQVAQQAASAAAGQGRVGDSGSACARARAASPAADAAVQAVGCPPTDLSPLEPDRSVLDLPESNTSGLARHQAREELSRVQEIDQGAE